MKKTLIKVLLLLVSTTFGMTEFLTANAEETEEKINIVEVTEKIPWADCELKEWSTLIYKCKVWRGFSSIMLIMWKILKYFTFLAGLFSVLMLVIGWIMYSMWGANEEFKTKSKDFIIKSLLGLIVLLLSWLILYAVAPWVYV